MNDEELIARAREVWAEMRFSPSDRERLAAWLLKELADRLEEPAAEPAEAKPPPI